MPLYRESALNLMQINNSQDSRKAGRQAGWLLSGMGLLNHIVRFC